MKNLKKVLCFVLVCVLIGSLLPMTAAAATEYDIAGVEAIGSGYLYNSAKGAYQPKWNSTKALAPDGSALDYSITTGLFYTSYSGGTFGEKLTTEPAYGETYYSYLIIDCPNYNAAELDETLFKVSIPGFIVKYKTDYFGDAGFTWRIIFSATRYEDVYVGGVRLQAGQCFPSGSSESQATKPETGYAYNAGEYLELNCFSYEGNGLSRKAGIYAEHDLAIKVIGNCSLYMAEGCDGIKTTKNLLYVTGGPLTIYADRCGIYAGKNVTLSNSTMSYCELIIETNREECVYAGNDLTVGDYAILNLNCKDTGNHGLGALMAENGSVSMGNRDVLVANKAYGTLKTPHSAADVASYPRIVVHKFTDQVIVGNVKLTDGQYLAVGGTAATTAKPSGGYAYFSDGILTLHNYTLKNSPYKTSSYTTYDEYIQIFAPNAYVLSLSGNNKLESDEKVTSAVRAPNDLFIQQEASGGSLEIDSYKVGIHAHNSEVFFDSGKLDITSTDTGISCGNGILFFNNIDLTIHSRNTYGIFQRDDYGDPPANQNDITVIGGKLDIRSHHEGIYALSAASDFRMTGGECTVVTERGSAIEAGNNIRILGGKLYLKVVSDYWDSGNAALKTNYGQTVIASGLPVKASTESYGQLGAYDPAKVKEYDWVTIGNPTAPQLTSYTVTFNPNGGPGETVTFTGINEGGYVIMPAAPAADWDGRAFLGWKPADATGNAVLEPGKNSNITKDTEFLAQWEPVALAEANAFVDVPTRGKTPDMTPTVPEGANYTAQVDYYYYATSGSYYHMTATDTFPAYKNCSLRIRFTPNPGYKFDQNTKFTVNGRSTDHYGYPGAEEVDFYVFGPKVTFDPNGGSVSTTVQEVNSAGNLSSLPTPTWKDNTMRFDGWYTQKTGGEKVSTSTKFTDDTTIYARWVENRYTITFDPNGGSVTPTTKQTEADGWLTGLPTPTHSDPNKLFDGWHTSKTSYSKVADECKFSEDTTLYAHWKDKPAHSIAEVYIESIQTPAAGVMPSNHVTITTAGVHGITDSGDTFWVRYDAATNNLTDLYEDETFVDSVPFRAGETYLLMLVMEAEPNYGFTPDVKVFYKGAELPALSMSDATASATLHRADDYIVVIINPGDAAPATYTVTFDSDGGSAVAKQTVEEGKAAAKPADPTRSGYTFKGWYLGDSKYDFSKAITGNITLKAKWEKITVAPTTYTVTFDSDGGSAVAKQTVESGKAASKPADPTRSGYTFKGWYLGDSKYDFSKAITGNITLKAKWEKITVAPTTYTVTFDSDGGSAVAKQTVESGKAASKPADPTRSGYTFKGWFLGDSQYDFSKAITGNITLKAKWEKNAQPTTPTEPTVPDTPTTPTEPTVPDTPTTPTEPTVPDTPTTPTEPTVPDTPTTPTEPTVPEPQVTGVTRLAGADRYKTAFLAADQLKAQLGKDKFDTVVVASGTEFADALSGSYLASVKNAPMLLVKNNKNTLAQVKEYIQKNLNSGGTVYILGGEKAVPKAMESGLDGFQVKRLGGNTRYDTNLLILKEAGVDNKDILVCTGKGFADSLSASAAKRPILLVKDSLNSAQKDFLNTASGKKYVIGGKAAVNEKIENALKSYGEVKRLGGNTRYETSVLVAKEFFGAPKAAVLAYAQNFPDGLSGGALACGADAPLILTASGKEKAAAAYTKDISIKAGYTLGGTGLINDKAVKSIFAMAETDTIAVIQ